MKRLDVGDLLLVIGAGLVFVGCWQLSPSTAMILAGLFVCYLGVRIGNGHFN